LFLLEIFKVLDKESEVMSLWSPPWFLPTRNTVAKGFFPKVSNPWL